MVDAALPSMTCGRAEGQFDQLREGWERTEQEDAASWERLLEWPRQRGLVAERGLRLIVSDGSDGLKAALERVDSGPGVRHQQCSTSCVTWARR